MTDNQKTCFIGSGYCTGFSDYGNATLEQFKNFCSNLPADEKARLDGIAKFAAGERAVPINNQSEFYSSIDAN